MLNNLYYLLKKVLNITLVHYVNFLPFLMLILLEFLGINL